MKQVYSTSLAIICSLALFAQPGKEKNKDKGKDNTSVVDVKVKSQNDHDKKVWEGVSGASGCGIPSKNQPAKVRAAFQRDYPNAGAVTWTKCRGNWTATFSNGIWRSTAVYHANGQRRDTRTPIERTNLPGVVLEDIIRKRPGINIGNIIRIDLPISEDPIFRVKVGDTSPEYIYYKANGTVVTYDY